MVATSLLLLALSGPVPAPAPAAATPRTREYHVRTLDMRVREWITSGVSRSRTFETLLARLATSDLIVYITVSDRIPGGVAGQMSFVARTGPVRYVRIELVPDGSPNEMIALLGHELQHAVEVADNPRVVDSQTLAAFYVHTSGTPTEAGRYDSVAARLAGQRVRTELAGSRPAAPATAGAQAASTAWTGEDSEAAGDGPARRAVGRDVDERDSMRRRIFDRQ
jgi:hypothetical protein